MKNFLNSDRMSTQFNVKDSNDSVAGQPNLSTVIACHAIRSTARKSHVSPLFLPLLTIDAFVPASSKIAAGTHIATAAKAARGSSISGAFRHRSSRILNLYMDLRKRPPSSPA